MSSPEDPVLTAGPEALGASRAPRGARRIAPGVHFLAGFGNTTIVLGTEGAAVVDPGLFTNGPRVVEELRRLTDLPVRYIVYTHGHYDHAFGTPALLDDAAARGHDAPDIVGHVNVARRFARYARTAGHLAGTFDAQFAVWDRHGGDRRPHVGLDPRPRGHRGRRLHRVVAAQRGHTVPGPALRPRVGRGARGDGLARAGRHRVRPRRCVPGARPGHAANDGPGAPLPRRRGGPSVERGPMAGADPGRGGATGRPRRESVSPAALRVHVVQRPGIPRRYTGWYEGNPSMLFPSSRADVAHEVVGLVGGTAPFLDRARALAASGATEDVQRALHLVDFVLAHGDDRIHEAHMLKADLLDERATGERSFVAHNILASAAVLEREHAAAARGS